MMIREREQEMAPDEFWESVVLAFLLVGIAGLMWLRGRYVLRRGDGGDTRQHEQRDTATSDGSVYVDIWE